MHYFVEYLSDKKQDTGLYLIYQSDLPSCGQALYLRI